MAIGRKNLDEAGTEIESLFNNVSDNKETFFQKLSAMPALLKLAGYLPATIKRKGKCQEQIHRNPDLGILPVLKCWPHDGGRFYYTSYGPYQTSGNRQNKCRNVQDADS